MDKLVYAPPIRQQCRWCGELPGQCVCAETEAVGPVCETCKQSAPFHGMNECCACYIAYVLHEEPSAVDEIRRNYAGTHELTVFERELARQSEALMSAGLMRQVKGEAA